MPRHALTRALASMGLLGGIGTLGLATVGSPASARPLSGAGALVPTPNHALSLHGGTTDSLNWAGYAVTPGSGVTAVSSTLTVPSAGVVPPGFSASWAGIGGYSTSDLIQAGVSEDFLPSNPLLGSQYYAWYELLPAGETQITGCAGDTNCTVSPGDKITVDISKASGDTWNVDMSSSGTNNWTYAQQVTYTSSESSAEWIQEAPTLVALQTIPAPVGTVRFGPTSTYTQGGTTHTIAAGHPTLIDESPGLVNEATTSPLASDGQSFDVCVYAQSCAAP